MMRAKDELRRMTPLPVLFLTILAFTILYAAPVIGEKKAPEPISCDVDRENAALLSPRNTGFAAVEGDLRYDASFSKEVTQIAGLYAYERAGTDEEFWDQFRIADGSWKLSLQNCIETTLKRNLDILVKGYQTKIADATITARRAIFDPQFRFDFAASGQSEPQATQLGGGDVISSENQSWNFNWDQALKWGGGYTVGFTNRRFETDSTFASVNPNINSGLTLSIQQPILKNWGEENTKREILIAKNDKRASEAEFTREVMMNVSLAIDAYWDLVFQIDNLSVQKDALQLAKDFYDIEKARVDVGIKAPLDLAQAEAGVASREEAVIVAESAVLDAEDRLKRLMDLPATSELWNYAVTPSDRPEREEKEVSLEASMQTALDNRPEIRAAKYGIESNEIRIRYANNQLLPQLDFTASYGFSGLGGTTIERGGVGGEVVNELKGGYGDALSQVFGADFRTWRIGLELVIPIRNMLAESQRLTSRLNLQRDSDSLINLEAQIRQDVRRAVRKLDTDLKRTRVARIARELEEKKLGAQEKKYEHGLSTSFEVLQFQNDVTRSRSEEIRALTDLNRSIAQLELAMGTILETYGVKYLAE